MKIKFRIKTKLNINTIDHPILRPFSIWIHTFVNPLFPAHLSTFVHKLIREVMKTRVILISKIIICFLFQATQIYGQDSIRAVINLKTLNLKGESAVQEVSLPLRDSLTYINFEIKAIITSGDLTVELYDPDGEKYGNFSLAGSLDSRDKQETQMIRGKVYYAEASGSLVRYVKFPKIGLWKAKVITKKTAGVIHFNLTRGVTVLKLK